MLYFVTGNKAKIAHAHIALDHEKIAFMVKNLPLKEIQSDSISTIAHHKAQAAFELLKEPLVVKDDGWFFNGLNGFPGPYMKYVNQWFTAQDFLTLLADKPDRRITFREVICYVDAKREEIFENEVIGSVIKHPAGEDLPSAQICTFRQDGKTMAQANNLGIDPFDGQRAWKDFAKWYKS